MWAGPDFRYTRLLTNRRLLIPGNRNSEKNPGSLAAIPGQSDHPASPPRRIHA